MKDTTLCYIERDGKYLMLHRTTKKNDINHGKWIGVGGKFEPGETPEDCLLREVFEETGLTLTRWQYRGIVNFNSDQGDCQRMHLFTANGFTGELIPCNEGMLKWIDKQLLPGLPQWEGDKIFLELLQTSTAFIELTLIYTGDNLTKAILNGERIS